MGGGEYSGDTYNDDPEQGKSTAKENDERAAELFDSLETADHSGESAAAGGGGMEGWRTLNITNPRSGQVSSYEDDELFDHFLYRTDQKPDIEEAELPASVSGTTKRVLERFQTAGVDELGRQAAGVVAADLLADGISAANVATGIERFLEWRDPSVAPLDRFQEGLVAALPSLPVPGVDDDLDIAATHHSVSEKLHEQFKNVASVEVGTVIVDAHRQHLGKQFGREMAPFWTVAADETGNRSVPKSAIGVSTHSQGPTLNPLAVDVPEREQAAARQKMTHTRGVLREMFGDSITLYRGFAVAAIENTASVASASSLGQQLRDAAAAGEAARVDHYTLESWSMEPMVAAQYGYDGAWLEREIPVEKVAASGVTSPVLPTTEVVVAHAETAVYDPSQIHPGGGAVDAIRTTLEFGERLLAVASGNG